MSDLPREHHRTTWREESRVRRMKYDGEKKKNEKKNGKKEARVFVKHHVVRGNVRTADTTCEAAVTVHVRTADRAGRSLAISLRSLPRSLRAFAPSTRRIHHCLYPPRDPPSAIELTRRLQ